MRRRYLVAYSPTSLSTERIGMVERLAAGFADLVPVFKSRTLLAIADPALPVIASGTANVILGTVFDRGQRHALSELDLRLTKSPARLLVERYWGAYLAFLQDQHEGRLTIVRAPFGDLAAYMRPDAQGWLVASDAELIARASEERPTIDGDALARHLAAPELVGEETCLTGISELRGGDCVSLGAGRTSKSTMLWSPWTFTARADRCDDIEQAVRRVRDAAQTAVTASAASYSRVLLFLSGGLDSSIVASCLSYGKRPFSCLNLVTYDRVGDERHFARIVASALGVELTEAERDPRGVDFGRSLAATLPRPMARAFNQESERIAQNEALRVGATALLDGSGGDNLFCSHRSVAATADCLLTNGIGGRYFATAAALSDLTGAGLPLIFFHSIKRAWLRSARVPRRRDLSFLSDRYSPIACDRPDHPWLSPPANTLPGRALHVSLLTAAQALVESGSAAMPIDRVSPLISQPVAEACLRVPSWMWFAPGRDRAAARDAFEDVPRAVLDRRTKGTPAPFIADILARRRLELKPFLLDGVIGAMGLIDRDALQRLLDDPLTIRGSTLPRLLSLIDVEAWARCWN